MRKVREWIVRFGGLFNKRRKDRELDDEIESHLQLHIEDNLRLGMTSEEARREALIKLGGIESTKEAYRDQRGLPVLETLWQDIRYGARMLRKNPGFTAVAVITLALGIGANTAIFSVVNAILLRALPFPEAERLALVWDDRPMGNWPQMPLSLPNFLDVREQGQSCSGMSAWATGWLNLSGGTEPKKVQYAVASVNLFSMLGVRPMLGRDFLPEEDKLGGIRAVIISHGLWQRRFNANQQLMGQSIVLDGQSSEVCGVLPASFRFVSFPKETEVWLPFGLDPWGGQRLYNRNDKSLGVIARLKSGVTLAQAHTELSEISRRLEPAADG